MQSPTAPKPEPDRLLEQAPVKVADLLKAMREVGREVRSALQAPAQPSTPTP